MEVVFVIHSPKDAATAVYRGVLHRAEFLTSRGYKATVVSPDDFRLLRRVPKRMLPLIYPFVVAGWLGKQKLTLPLIVFHSYCGWVFNLLGRVNWGRGRAITITAFHGLEPIYYRRLKAAADEAGRPLSLRYRLLHGWLMPRLIRLSCRRSNLVTCLNSDELAYLASNLWMPPSNVVVAPNYVSDCFFVRRDKRETARRLLFVGQWLEMKGIRHLVDAFARLISAEPDLELWCVGTLEDEETVMASFPPEARGRVKVRPRVAHEEIVELYRGADLFVLPSLSEGFSNALLEAMAAGLPIVTTSVGAAPDILEADVSALLVPAGDADALHDAVSRLLYDSGLREKLSAGARSSAGEYKSEPVLRDYDKLLQRTVISVKG